MSDHEHSWYAGDSNSDTIWWFCRVGGCTAQKTTATAARHLNNAIAALYADAGPSAALVDIRTAMELLDIPENRGQSSEWEHWNSRGQTEWESP